MNLYDYCNKNVYQQFLLTFIGHPYLLCPFPFNDLSWSDKIGFGVILRLPFVIPLLLLY